MWFFNLVLGEVGVEILFKFVLLVIFKKNWDFVFGRVHFPLWNEIVKKRYTALLQVVFWNFGVKP